MSEFGLEDLKKGTPLALLSTIMLTEKGEAHVAKEVVFLGLFTTSNKCQKAHSTKVAAKKVAD